MIADKVRELMQKHNLNQTDLADRAGLSQAEISRIVNGKRGARPHFDTIIALADALKTDPRALAERSPNTQK